jgi:DUF1680 family protein
MRFIGSWPQVIATETADGVQVQQYASAEIVGGGLRLVVETDYPWSGGVRVTVVEAPSEPREIALRIPGWCDGATLRFGDGEVGRRPPDGRSIREARVWQPGDSVALELAMPPRVTIADPRVDAIRGCVALERGPLVYAIETADVPGGIDLEDLRLPKDPVPSTAPREDLARSAVGLAVTADGPDGPVEVGAIPYFAWANRGVKGMRVWIPRAGQ